MLVAKEKTLPPQSPFYSKLNDANISTEDYEHAQKVWKTFNIKNLGEYHDLSLKTDVLLLTDVFENFRKTCKNNYGLDPAHYLTAPGLSSDAMLMVTKVNLELISDIDMYQFVEKDMRGGISYISRRYAKANNKYMTDYDNTKESRYIIYLDANNLYGWAMSQPLPTGGFKWKEVKEINLDEYTDTSEKGLILEVDLDYPEELHKSHNDYPLAPERMKIGDEMLSKYSTDVKNLFNLTTGKVPKLMNTLTNKRNYIIHYRNLKQYISLGMKLTKI